MAGRVDLHVSRITTLDAKTSIREKLAVAYDNVKVALSAPALATVRA
jgi:hypothetical protein